MDVPFSFLANGAHSPSCILHAGIRRDGKLVSRCAWFRSLAWIRMVYNLRLGGDLFILHIYVLGLASRVQGLECTDLHPALQLHTYLNCAIRV